MLTALSTKILKLNQRSLLLHAGISLVEYNAINIEYLPFKVQQKVKNAIFTSQNAVLSTQNSKLEIEHCYCVGEKTKALLEEKGYNVVKMTEYATELSAYIVEKYQDEYFYFFCGNIRSDEIPLRLRENNIGLEEIVVYKTTLNPKKFDRTFDAVLFFSPSGVRSFCQENISISNTLFVCIGTTTASEARNFTENVVIANSTTVESVIAKAVKVLNT